MCYVNGKLHSGLPLSHLNNSQIRLVKVTNAFDFLYELILNKGILDLYLIFHFHIVATLENQYSSSPLSLLSL